MGCGDGAVHRSAGISWPLRVRVSKPGRNVSRGRRNASWTASPCNHSAQWCHKARCPAAGICLLDPVFWGYPAMAWRRDAPCMSGWAGSRGLGRVPGRILRSHVPPLEITLSRSFPKRRGVHTGQDLRSRSFRESWRIRLIAETFSQSAEPATDSLRTASIDIGAATGTGQHRIDNHHGLPAARFEL